MSVWPLRHVAGDFSGWFLVCLCPQGNCTWRKWFGYWAMWVLSVFLCSKHCSRAEQAHRAQCPLAANAWGLGQDILSGQNYWWWITRTGHWFPRPCSSSAWQLLSGVCLLTRCNARVHSHFWVWMQMSDRLIWMTLCQCCNACRVFEQRILLNWTLPKTVQLEFRQVQVPGYL